MNSPNTEIQKKFHSRIERYKDLILLLETGAYIHDLGKLSSFFIISKAKGVSAKDFHGQIIFIDMLNKDFNDIFKDQKMREFLFAPIYQILGLPQVSKGIDLGISLSHLVCAHHGCSRCLYGVMEGEMSIIPNGTCCKYRDLIEKHPLINLLKTVDHLDASNPADKGKQGTKKVLRDNIFFEPEEIPLSRLNEMRFSFYNKLLGFLHSDSGTNIELLNKFVKSIGKKYFPYTLSETRTYGNDITLLHHAESVSTYFKMYLFEYFVMDRELPSSFFDVKYKVLSVPERHKETEEILSYKLALTNLVGQSDHFSYFLFPAEKKNSQFLKFIKDAIRSADKQLILSPLNDFSPMFSDTFEGIPLSRFYEKLRALPIKSPEDIKMSEEEVIKKLKDVILFAALRKKERLLRKLKSSLRHIDNLKNGMIYNEKILIKYMRKKKEIDTLEKKLSAYPSIESIKRATGWKSSKDPEKEIYDFFNIILSPIRPPSPVEMSEFFLKEYHRLHSMKALYEEHFHRRPLTLGRIYAIFEVLVKLRVEEKSAEKF